MLEYTMANRLAILIAMAFMGEIAGQPYPNALARTALLELYGSTGGEQWIRQNNWATNSSFCAWEGVVCNPDLDNVLSLNLTDNNVNGELDDSICFLDELEMLILGMNQLTGSLPSCLFNVTTLTTIDVSHNSLKGDIGDFLFEDHISNLMTFVASNNSFTGKVGNLAILKLLQNVDLRGNKLSGGIDALADLDLRYVDFSRNSISFALDTTMGFQNWTNLVHLSLCCNRITGKIPPDISTMRSLEVLDLSLNSLQGELPDELFMLSNLKYLILSANNFRGNLNSEVESLVQLNTLAVTSNKFYGIVPSSIGKLTQLRMLLLEDNQFEGDIADSLTRVTSIERLDISSNIFTGSLDSLKKLKSLSRFSARRNRIGGVIPSWFPDLMHQSSEIHLDFNHLSCEVPEFEADDFRFFSLEDEDLTVLTGNLFSCPLSDNLLKADYNGRAYTCGYNLVLRAGWVCGSCLGTFIVVFCFVVVLTAKHLKGRFTSWAAWKMSARQLFGAFSPHRVSRDLGLVQGQSAVADFERLCLYAVLMVAFLATSILLPLYIKGDASFDCRLSWVTTSAFLDVTEPHAWIFISAILAAVVFPGILMTVVYVGSSRAVVGSGGRPNNNNEYLDKKRASMPWVRRLVVILVVLVLLILQGGTSVGFVRMMEASFVASEYKILAQLTFAVAHEAMRMFIIPLCMSMIWGILQEPDEVVHLRTTYHLLLFFNLCNSLVMPMVVMLMFGERCFYPVLPLSDEGYSQVSYPSCDMWSMNECVQEGFSWVEVHANRGFNVGAGCLSSFTIIFLPAYLIILSFRGLLVPSWWVIHAGWKAKHPDPFDISFTPLSMRGDSSTVRAATLPALERNVFSLSVIAIVLCVGFPAPLAAVAGCLCLAVRQGVRWFIGDTQEHLSFPPVPIGCFAQILLVQTIYIGMYFLLGKYADATIFVLILMGLTWVVYVFVYFRSAHISWRRDYRNTLHPKTPRRSPINNSDDLEEQEGLISSFNDTEVL